MWGPPSHQPEWYHQHPQTGTEVGQDEPFAESGHQNDVDALPNVNPPARRSDQPDFNEGGGRNEMYLSPRQAARRGMGEPVSVCLAGREG